MNSDDFPEPCFPSDHDFKFVEGVWEMDNALLGLVGNLLTTLAIPFAYLIL